MRRAPWLLRSMLRPARAARVICVIKMRFHFSQIKLGTLSGQTAHVVVEGEEGGLTKKTRVCGHDAIHKAYLSVFTPRKVVCIHFEKKETENAQVRKSSKRSV